MNVVFLRYKKVDPQIYAFFKIGICTQHFNLAKFDIWYVIANLEMHIPPVETSTSSSFIHLKISFMRYQNFAFTKAYRRLSYFFCLCIFITISSCSDEKAGSTTATTTATEKPNEQVQASGTVCSDFAYLALSADTLRKIFTN